MERSPIGSGSALALCLCSALALLFPAPRAASAQAADPAFLGTWRVVTVGLSDQATGRTKMVAPSQQYYTFYRDKTGLLKSGNVNSMFAWTLEAGTLRVKFREGRVERYSTVAVTPSEEKTVMALGGLFDYLGDGHEWTVSVGLWKE